MPCCSGSANGLARHVEFRGLIPPFNARKFSDECETHYRCMMRLANSCFRNIDITQNENNIEDNWRYYSGDGAARHAELNSLVGVEPLIKVILADDIRPRDVLEGGSAVLAVRGAVGCKSSGRIRPTGASRLPGVRAFGENFEGAGDGRSQLR